MKDTRRSNRHRVNLENQPLRTSKGYDPCVENLDDTEGNLKSTCSEPFSPETKAILFLLTLSPESSQGQPSFRGGSLGRRSWGMRERATAREPKKDGEAG